MAISSPKFARPAIQGATSASDREIHSANSVHREISSRRCISVRVAIRSAKSVMALTLPTAQSALMETFCSKTRVQGLARAPTSVTQATTHASRATQTARNASAPHRANATAV